MCSSLKDKRTTKRASFDDTGANAVEFALVLPLLLVLLFGLVDFARMGFVQLSVTAASKEGARYSSLYSSGFTDTAPLQTFVQATAPEAASVSQLASPAQLTVAVTTCSATVDNENTTVTVSTNFKWLLPIDLLKIVAPNSTLVGNFTISSQGIMRCMN